VIRDIDRGLARDNAAALDYDRQQLHVEIEDLMYRLHLANNRDDVHNFALRIARDG
jgi:hypothetical protein